MERVQLRTALPLLSICASVASCVSAYDPFLVPRERVSIFVHTVALRPLSVEWDLVDVDRIRAMLEPRAAAMLREGGFEVVTPEEWDRRWLAIAHEVGEIWDPVTGERDDARYEVARSALYHELAVERSVDAVVHLMLYSGKVEGSGRSPMLCGNSREVYWPGRLPPLARVTLAYGACLGVSVTDMDDQELYGIRQGLEFMETYALQSHAVRPLDTRLRDVERIEEALEAILGPLVEVGAAR